MIAVSIVPAAVPVLGARLDCRALARALAAAQAVEPAAGPAADVARDEAWWRPVQQAFTVDRGIVNLNNGGVSPAPASVQAAMKRHLDVAHEAPAHTMWRVQRPRREEVRQRLAAVFGAGAEEIAITRNASEGLETCQLGFDLAPGDEVLTTDQDYPLMISTFRQRERREGIVLRQVSLPVPAESAGDVVRIFEAGITDRTRLILMCHMINLTGQVLPVRSVVSMARARGIPVIVDGAHALAHLDFTLAELECDFYATSLHKWLCGPHGTGLLYVRQERIADLWPLMGAGADLDGDIRRFEEIGTYPVANSLAIEEALRFHEAIGPAVRQARLVHLRDAWARRLLVHDRVRLHTSLEPGFAGGMATMEVEGLDSGDLCRRLWEEHRILTTAIVHEQFEGVRISPNVYTTMEELERFCEAVEREMMRS